MPPRLLPVPGAAALRLETRDPRLRCLVVADLHLGLGAIEGGPEGPPEAGPPALADAILASARRYDLPTVVIAGDVKHPIVGVPRPLRRVLFDFFATLLSERLAVEVVLGNHDVGLVPHLPREVLVHPSGGVVRERVGIFHGHRWPAEPLLRQPYLVAGHLHPGFRFAASLHDEGTKRRCWVRTTFPPVPRRTPARRRPRRFDARELVVLPAFHPLGGIEDLNRHRPRRGRSFLFARFLSKGSGRLYLLDGTDLGPLRVPPGSPAGGAPRRAPSAR